MEEIRTTKEAVLNCFEDVSAPADALINLYKIAFPNFDAIKKIKGYPKVSRATATFCIERLLEIADNASLIWLNRGFSVDDKMLEDWLIDLSGVELILS